MPRVSVESQFYLPLNTLIHTWNNSCLPLLPCCRASTVYFWYLFSILLRLGGGVGLRGPLQIPRWFACQNMAIIPVLSMAAAGKCHSTFAITHPTESKLLREQTVCQILYHLVTELAYLQSCELSVCIMLTVATRSASRGSTWLILSPPASRRRRYLVLSALRRNSSDLWCPALTLSLVW